MAQFVSGSVLTASSLNSQFNTQTIATATSNYTVGSANAGELVLLNSASAGTVTIPLDATYNFPTGTIIGLYNSGAGSWSVATAGTASTVSGSSTTLAQYSSATLLKTAASTWVIAAGGSGSPKVSVSSTTGSPSTSSVTGGTLYTWTSSGSVTFSSSGWIRVLVVSGGGGASTLPANSGGGGGVQDVQIYVSASTTYTVTIGAAGTYPDGSGGISSFVLANNMSVRAKSAYPYNLGNGADNSNATGIYSNISGSSIGYGGAGYSTTNSATFNAAFGGAPSTTPYTPRANSGGGGYVSGPGPGAAGTVQILI